MNELRASVVGASSSTAAASAAAATAAGAAADAAAAATREQAEHRFEELEAGAYTRPLPVQLERFLWDRGCM
jgi:hypothetical protein